MMSHRLTSVLLALALLLPGWRAQAAGGDDQGGEAKGAAKPDSRAADKEKEEQQRKSKQHSLEDRIRPVSGNLFLKEKRLEISPTVSMSLGDAFFQKYGVGLKLAWHNSETTSLGGTFFYAHNSPSDVVTACRNETCIIPSMTQLADVPGKVDLIVGLDGAWAPIYGKLNLVAEKVVHFDLGATAGLGAIQYQIPGAKTAMTVTGYVGVGQRYFITSSMTLRLELRDYVYSAQIVKLGNSDSKLENQVMLELGLSFFAGSMPEY